MSTTTTFFDKLVSPLTTRELMQTLRVSYVTLKDRSRDPSKLSVEQVMRLAPALGMSVDEVVILLLEEIRRNPSPTTDLLAAQGLIPPARKTPTLVLTEK